MSESILLSVVVPVYNDAASVVANIETIIDRIGSGLGGEFELIVVSDGSFDRTADNLYESRGERVRIFHYDRNLGKGYALKLGGLQARGRWVGYVDGDLDLDPSAIPLFVRHAERRSLDIVIGSKRHARSVVHYPRSRRAASWLYQQLVRILFRLDVRDTQVGLKVFSREVADEVLPLLLVKRFAFDLELLAVARSLGFSRIEEQPISLDYRFTGSGVGSVAVARALVDTAAIFYRLRILGYYGRKQRLLGQIAGARADWHLPRVTLIASDAQGLGALDYPKVERCAAPTTGSGELLAFVAPGAVVAGNWLSASVPFFANPSVEAVVCAALAPNRGPARRRAAAAVQESRLGGGSLYFRFVPGNLRLVEDFPAPTIVVRRSAWDALPKGTPTDEVAARLVERGGMVVYTPETVVVTPVPPLFGPHLGRVAQYGRRRGSAVRVRGPRALRASTVIGLAAGALALSAPLVLVGGVVGAAWFSAAGVYLVVISSAAAVAALRFRSLAVGMLSLLAFPITHAVYAAAFASGVVRPR